MCMKTKSLVLIITSILLLSLFSISVLAIRKTGSQGDYFPMNNFKLEIDGVIVAGFKEVSGLESETEISLNKIVLKRGFINDPAIKQWFNETLEECSSAEATQRVVSLSEAKKFYRGYTITCEPRNKSERKSGSVIVLDKSGSEILRYNFYEAWPTRWKAPSLDSKGDTHMIEELELVVERVEKD